MLARPIPARRPEPAPRSETRRRARGAQQTEAARLVRRCADGDADALAELCRLYWGWLVGVARGILKSPEDAEEVVQEVFLYLWRRADRYDPNRSAVSTWLTRIAQSRAIDRLRQAGTRERGHERLAAETSSTVPPRGDDRLLHEQRARALDRALRTLPAPQRQVLVLAYYGGLTQSEIARRVAIPLGTVKTRTSIGLRKLREQLGAQAGALA